MLNVGIQGDKKPKPVMGEKRWALTIGTLLLWAKKAEIKDRQREGEIKVER